MKKKRTPTACDHQLLRRDEDGNYYISFACPDCEAAGVTVSDDVKRETLVELEAICQRLGYQLADVVTPESRSELERLQGRTTI